MTPDLHFCSRKGVEVKLLLGRLRAVLILLSSLVEFDLTILRSDMK